MKLHGKRIIVPTRSINGGFDFKFETDPYDVDLYGIMTPDEYTDTIQHINDELRPSRSNAVDQALLFSGMLIVPLALWGGRHAYLTKKRKKLLSKEIISFNQSHPDLLMRWNPQPDSFLSIERKPLPTADAVPEVATAELVESSSEQPQQTQQTQPQQTQQQKQQYQYEEEKHEDVHEEEGNFLL